MFFSDHQPDFAPSPSPQHLNATNTKHRVKHKAVYLLLPTSQSINQPNLWIGYSNSIAYTITDYRLLSPHELRSVVPPTIILPVHI